jgi:hypothetical protein
MIDFDWNIGRIWLYSGIFGGWWCYNNFHNIKINKMYKDYCHRNNISYVDIISDKIKSTPLHESGYSGNTLMCESGYSGNTLCNTNPKINTNMDVEKVFDFVNFDDVENNKIISNFATDYIIRVSNEIFRIDLDKMKQINVNDPQKQRNIQYTDIPEEILNNKDKIILYLKGINVMGIAGKKFN